MTNANSMGPFLFGQLAAQGLAKEMRKLSGKSYPHHSERECARRRRQLVRGMIQLSEVQ